jgi:anti-sigma B factor antagonist
MGSRMDSPGGDCGKRACTKIQTSGEEFMGQREFVCKVKKSSDDGGEGTWVICEGDLVAGATDAMKDVVRPLIAERGRVVVDMEAVTYVDSMGLGSMVGLKTSAAKAGNCQLEFTNLSHRVQHVVRITGLASLFQLT